MLLHWSLNSTVSLHCKLKPNVTAQGKRKGRLRVYGREAHKTGSLDVSYVVQRIGVESRYSQVGILASTPTSYESQFIHLQNRHKNS